MFFGCNSNQNFWRFLTPSAFSSQNFNSKAKVCHHPIFPVEILIGKVDSIRIVCCKNGSNLVDLINMTIDNWVFASVKIESELIFSLAKSLEILNPNSIKVVLEQSCIALRFSLLPVELLYAAWLSSLKGIHITFLFW